MNKLQQLTKLIDKSKLEVDQIILKVNIDDFIIIQKFILSQSTYTTVVEKDESQSTENMLVVFRNNKTKIYITL